MHAVIKFLSHVTHRFQVQVACYADAPNTNSTRGLNASALTARMAAAMLASCGGKECSGEQYLGTRKRC